MEGQTVIRRAAIPAGLFLSALAIQLVGIDFGLPHMYHWDEHFLAAPISRFLAHGQLLPHVYCYPSGYIYLQSILSPLSYLIFILKNGAAPAAAMQLSDYLLVARIVTAIIGAAGVTLSFYFAVRVWRDRLAGIIAAAVLALSPLHAMDSRFLTTDIPMATFAFLGVYLLFIHFERRDWKTFLAAAAVAGASVACKYNAAFFVAGAVAVLAVREKGPIKPLAFAAIAAATFLLLTPGIIFESSKFYNHVSTEVSHYFVVGEINQLLTFSLWDYFKILWCYGLTPGPLLFAAGGIVLYVFRYRGRAIPLLVFPACYLVFLFLTKSISSRAVDPLLPYGAIFAGLAAATLTRRLRKSVPLWTLPILLTALGVGFTFRSVIITGREAASLVREDPRDKAKTWFEGEVPWPQRVAKEAVNPALQTEGGQIETPPIDPYKYEVVVGPYIAANSVTEYAVARIPYLITQDLEANTEKLLTHDPSRAEVNRKNYESIIKNTELVFRLNKPHDDTRAAVEIYRINDDVLKINNPPKKKVRFEKKWVRSEADPAKPMAKAGGRYVLTAPSRAGAYFTAPAREFTLAVNVEPLAGRPTVVVEVDGTAVARRRLTSDGVVRTGPLKAPPYYKHVAVRCLGPAGSIAVLKGASVHGVE